MQFNARSICELSLADGDELQLEINKYSGKVVFTVSGKNGSEPYTGNDLESGIFTFTVSETDEYVLKLPVRMRQGKLQLKS